MGGDRPAREASKRRKSFKESSDEDEDDYEEESDDDYGGEDSDSGEKKGALGLARAYPNFDGINNYLRPVSQCASLSAPLFAIPPPCFQHPPAPRWARRHAPTSRLVFAPGSHGPAGKKGKAPAAPPASAGKGAKGAAKPAAAAAQKGSAKPALASAGKGASSGAKKPADKPGKKVLAEPVQEIATGRALEIAKESQRILERARALKARPGPRTRLSTTVVVSWPRVLHNSSMSSWARHTSSVPPSYSRRRSRSSARAHPARRTQPAPCPSTPRLVCVRPAPLPSPAPKLRRAVWLRRGKAATPHPFITSCHPFPPAVVAAVPKGGVDIVKRNKQRSHRLLFILPGQMAPLSKPAAAPGGGAAGGEKDAEEGGSRQIVRAPRPPLRRTSAAAVCFSADGARASSRPTRRPHLPARPQGTLSKMEDGNPVLTLNLPQACRQNLHRRPPRARPSSSGGLPPSP